MGKLEALWIIGTWFGVGWWARGRKESKEKGNLMHFYTNLLDVHTKENK